MDQRGGFKRNENSLKGRKVKTKRIKICEMQLKQCLKENTHD